MHPDTGHEKRSDVMLSASDFIFWQNPSNSDDWKKTFNILNVVSRDNPAIPSTETLVPDEGMYKREMYYFACNVIDNDLNHNKIEGYKYSSTQWKLRATAKNPNYSYQQHIMRLYTKNVTDYPNGDEPDNPAAKLYNTKTETDNG